MHLPKQSGKTAIRWRLAAAVFVFLGLVVLVFIFHQRRLAARTLVYNDWYAGEFAARVCLHTKPMNTGCPLEARAQENEFAGRFSAAFASDPTCSGLRLVIYQDSKAPPTEMMELFSGDFWWLMVNFDADHENQNWMLSRSKISYAPAGEGDAARTSHQVCAILKGRGGTTN
jgi:hypothetical protein